MIRPADCRRAKSLIRTHPMTENLIIEGKNDTGRVRHGTSTAYLPVHDHKRLPGRFFARLRHSDGCLAG